MKITIIYPPFTLEELYSKLESLGNTSPPLGIGYIGGALETAGHQVKIIDAPPVGLSISDVLKEVKAFNPDLIGMTALTPDYHKAVALAKALKKDNPDRPMIIGGPHITAQPDETIAESLFDYGVIGEGEETVVELVKKIESNKLDQIKEVKGIIYKEGDRVVKTPPRNYVENLDDLPNPARHLMPAFDRYHPTPASYQRLPVGTMITSRGCPFKCVFCDRSVFGNQFRFRTAENVVDEVELVLKEFGAKEIRFWDDTINVDPKRVIEICQEILKRKLDFSWTCLARVNFMNEEVARWMKKAGCWQISYGVESGSDKILMKVRKGETTDMVRKAIDITQKAGIRVRGFFMFGLPGDTEETMQQTIDFAKELDIDVAGFYVTIPFPNTELTKEALKKGEIEMSAFDKFKYDQYLVNLPDKLSFIPEGLSEEKIRAYQNRAYHEFYIRPRYILRQLIRIKGLRDLYNKIKAFFVIRDI